MPRPSHSSRPTVRPAFRIEYLGPRLKDFCKILHGWGVTKLCRKRPSSLIIGQK
jgi:hypothetical protein